jgi:lysophospholipase
LEQLSIFISKNNFAINSQMKTFQTDDGIHIRYKTFACQSDACRGTVVLLGGRSEFIEKYWETVDDLQRRNFDVFAFDWRGQGLSDRMLPNRHKGYVASYDDYLADLNTFMDRYVKPKAKRPIIILAHSMGAHITLRYLHDYPDVVDRVILTSPLIDIAGPEWIKQFLKLVVGLMTALGFKTSYATRAMDFDPSKKHFRGNRLTRDRARFEDTINKISGNSDLAVGGVTFGWLAAMNASIRVVLEENYCQNINTPTMILSAGSDSIVSNKSQQLICRRMPNCRLITISDALHEMLIETDPVRKKIWAYFEDFVGSPSEN